VGERRIEHLNVGVKGGDATPVRLGRERDGSTWGIGSHGSTAIHGAVPQLEIAAGLDESAAAGAVDRSAVPEVDAVKKEGLKG
jgi:hypothetical protein